MAIPKSVLAAAVVATFLVPGCAGPEPTYSCTPEAGGEPYTCVKAQYDLMVERDKLYAEAEAVYVKYFAENTRIFQSGGVTQPTPVMLDTLTGEGLDQASQTYKGLRTSGLKIIAGEYRLVWLHRAPKEVMGGSVVAFESCIDGSGVTFEEGKTTYPGNFFQKRTYYSPTSSGLKISNFMTFTGAVDAC